MIFFSSQEKKSSKKILMDSYFNCSNKKIKEEYPLNCDLKNHHLIQLLIYFFFCLFCLFCLYFFIFCLRTKKQRNSRDKYRKIGQILIVSDL